MRVASQGSSDHDEKSDKKETAEIFFTRTEYDDNAASSHSIYVDQEE